MRRMVLIIIALLAAAPIFVEAGWIGGGIQIGIGDNASSSESAPEPRLIAPVSETLDLTGKDVVEFKWDPFVGKLFKRRYYDFWLFKGREQLARNIILKKKLAANAYSIVLKTDQFEDGQVYTWAVRQAYYDQKSDWAFSAFLVIKKKQ